MARGPMNPGAASPQVTRLIQRAYAKIEAESPAFVAALSDTDLLVFEAGVALGARALMEMVAAGEL